MTPLTDNQEHLLRACLNPRTTKDLGELNKSDGYPFGEDAARSAIKRLEQRGLVARNAAGGWFTTPKGVGEIAPVEDESGIRKYVVLEEKQLHELADLDPGTVVYLQVLLPEARNVEHALRQTAKSGKYNGTDEEPTLVAVATRQWKPTPVRIHTRQTVSVG